MHPYLLAALVSQCTSDMTRGPKSCLETSSAEDARRSRAGYSCARILWNLQQPQQATIASDNSDLVELEHLSNGLRASQVLCITRRPQQSDRGSLRSLQQPNKTMFTAVLGEETCHTDGCAT